MEIQVFLKKEECYCPLEVFVNLLNKKIWCGNYKESIDTSKIYISKAVFIRLREYYVNETPLNRKQIQLLFAWYDFTVDEKFDEDETHPYVAAWHM